MSATFLIKTLGCKANSVDSMAIRESLLRIGLEETKQEVGADPQVVVINSCSVTDQAQSQSIRTARRVAKRNPSAKIVFTGCAAEVNPDEILKKMGSSASIVVSNREKTNLESILSETNLSPRLFKNTVSYSELKSQHPIDREWPAPINPESKTELGLGHSKTRAFLKIQEGCDAFCTYCIIPYARGPARSIAMPELLKQVQELEKTGFLEIVLTGTNIGDYESGEALGRGTRGEELRRLVETLLKGTSRVRFRLSSLDPSEISPELIDLVQNEERLCPHFHVSLQSPHSLILRRMKRKYSQSHVSKTLNLIHQKQRSDYRTFVGMDLIAGFPGETDEMFKESIAFLHDLPWSRLHVFPYSERKGTPATKLEGSVPITVRKLRTNEWMNLSRNRLKHFLEDQLSVNPKMNGVLLEEGGLGGYSPNYIRFELIEAIPERSNQTVRVCEPVIMQTEGGSQEWKVQAKLDS